MSQTTQLLDALKRCLKAKGLNYRDVARALEISEASVKRIFSEQTFSLKRLEDVCRLLDLNVYELAKLTKMYTEDEVRELDMRQEEALAKDSKLLTYFYLLLNGWTADQIAKRYDLNELTQTRILVRLDRLKLVELFPKNRVRLLTARRIAWRKDGPVRQMYERQVKELFLKTRFDGQDEVLSLETGELSEASTKLLCRKLERIVEEFDELAELDLTMPQDKKQSVGLMMAFRPWTYWDIVGHMDSK